MEVGRLADLSSLYEQVKNLCQAELYQSAVTVGGILVSKAQNLVSQGIQTSPPIYTCTIAFADALYGKREYRRSLHFYQQGQEQLRLIDSTSLEDRSSRRELEIRLNFRQAQCHEKLNEQSKALPLLDKIPRKARTLEMHVASGRISAKLGLKKTAIIGYKDALRLNPYALECVEALLTLGYPPAELRDLLADCTVPNREDGTLLRSFGHSHALAAEGQIRQSIQAFSELEQRLPRHVYSLLQIGRLHYEAGDSDECLYIFKKARELDPFNLDHMDIYAAALKETKPESVFHLHSTVETFLSIDERRPESWLAAAHFSHGKGELERAIYFAEKAISLDSLYAAAYDLKGKLLLALGRIHEAVNPFFQANSLKKDLSTFKGLVEAYLAIPKYKEALTVAKEALQMLPKSPKAIALVGRVLVKAPEGREKAKRAFNKALALDPSNLDVLVSLVDVYVAEKNYMEPEKLLRGSLEKHGDNALLLTELGHVLALKKEYGEALGCYHMALTVDPNYVSANTGLERVEKLMRGVDPDAPTEDEQLEDAPLEGDADGDYGD